MSWSDFVILFTLFAVVETRRAYPYIINDSSMERELVEEEDVRIGPIPKLYETHKTQKPLKRIFVKPRRHPMITPLQTTTETTTLRMTTFPQQISEDDIDVVTICENVKTIAHNYRIGDMPKFARNNCVLIRLYYPNASCNDIITIVDYCFSQ